MARNFSLRRLIRPEDIAMDFDPAFLSKHPYESERGHPLKGESREKTPPPTKKSLFLLGSKPSTSTAPFSPLFAPVTSCLFGSGHSLTHTSHPSGSMRPRRIKALLCLKPCLKHSPWSFSLDPRKSSLCRVNCNVEYLGRRFVISGSSGARTLHYVACLSNAISLSGGSKVPLRSEGGVIASIALSFSIGSVLV